MKGQSNQGSNIRWILFDLGNVLVSHIPCGTRKIAGHLGIDIDSLHSFLLDMDASRRLCTGEMDPAAMTAMLNSRFSGRITPQMIVAWFGPEVENVYPEIPPLIASLAGRYSLGILSNTFFGHWDYFITTDLARRFKAMLPSHLLGCVKPDPRIYAESLKRIRAEPAETLFIDDREENVAGARGAGINAFRSESPADTIRGLNNIGIRTTEGS